MPDLNCYLENYARIEKFVKPWYTPEMVLAALGEDPDCYYEVVRNSMLAKRIVVRDELLGILSQNGDNLEAAAHSMKLPVKVCELVLQTDPLWELDRDNYTLEGWNETGK